MDDESAGQTRFPGVRAVSYDLWLTLIRDHDNDAVWDERVRRLRSVLALSQDEVQAALESAHEAHRSSWEEGRALPYAELVTEVVRSGGRDESDDDLRSAVSAALDEPTLEAGVELLPGARETVNALADAGIAVGLVCDTGFTSGDTLRRVLDDLGLLPRFSALVFSEEIGVPKPSEEPFRALLDRLDLPPEVVVHVGDLRRKDAAGARAAGLRSVRYRGARDDEDEDPDMPDADAVIDRHDELLGLLGLDVPAAG